MKIILAGSSGFIGAEVLRQCLLHPSITSLVALSRRDLPISDPKLKTVLVKDWTQYEPEALKECKGAEACIWTLGTNTLDIDIQKQVTLDYTVAAMTAFSRLPGTAATTATAKPQQPFRFVFTSGILAERDQSKSLWFASAIRRITGEAENRLLDFSAQHKDAFDAFIVRPGPVVKSTGGLSGLLVAVGAPIVGVKDLAAVMVELVVKGAGEKVWENRELRERRGELLRGERGK